LKLYLQKYREGMKGDKGAGGDEFEGIASAEELMGSNLQTLSSSGDQASNQVLLTYSNAGSTFQL
jgi:hypothetical protein